MLDLIKSLIEAPEMDANEYTRFRKEAHHVKREFISQEINDYIKLQLNNPNNNIRLQATLIQGVIACEIGDYALAESCFEEGIRYDNSYALKQRADMYEEGLGEPDNQPNYPAAIALYERSIALNNSSAMSNRAYMYKKGQGEADNQPNYPAAIALYERAIALNNSSAMYNRAYMYQQGQGEPDNQPNYPAAIALYERAIALNNSKAMNNRAYMHEYGQGEPNNQPNYPAAITLYERAIALNDTNAMVNRAIMYFKGQGEPDNQPNYPAAIALFERAITLNSTEAMYNRALMYQQGQGEPDNQPNYPAAIALFDRAIALNSTEAMVNRATMYFKGQGELGNQPNYIAAIRLYTQAMTLNNSNAKKHLADIFAKKPEVLIPLLDIYLEQLNIPPTENTFKIPKNIIELALSIINPTSIATLKAQAITLHEALEKNDITSALILIKNLPIEYLPEQSLFLWVSFLYAELRPRAELLEEPGKSHIKQMTLNLALQYLNVGIIKFPESTCLATLHACLEDELSSQNYFTNTLEEITEPTQRQESAKLQRKNPQLQALIRFFEEKERKARTSFLPDFFTNTTATLQLTQEVIVALKSGKMLSDLIQTPKVTNHSEFYSFCLNLLLPNPETIDNLITVYELTDSEYKILINAQMAKLALTFKPHNTEKESALSTSTISSTATPIK